MDEDEVNDDEGFRLEYVLQAGPPAVHGGPPTGGPHLLEIVGKGAHMCWPYICQLSFVTDIAATFSRYFVRPWVSPNPEARIFCHALVHSSLITCKDLLVPQQ